MAGTFQGLRFDLKQYKKKSGKGQSIYYNNRDINWCDDALILGLQA